MNRAMSRKLRVNEEGPPVLGGFFGKTMQAKHWDGVVHEFAALRLEQQLHNRATEPARLREMLEACARWGVTSIQLMSLPNDPQRLVDLLVAVGSPIRVRIIPMPLTGPAGRLQPVYPAVPAPSPAGSVWTALSGCSMAHRSSARQRNVSLMRTIQDRLAP